MASPRMPVFAYSKRSSSIKSSGLMKSIARGGGGGADEVGGYTRSTLRPRVSVASPARWYVTAELRRSTPCRSPVPHEASVHCQVVRHSVGGPNVMVELS